MKHWRRAIYAMQSIDGFAGGLIGIFIPIYFLNLGFSVKDIFLFFIVNNLAVLFFFFLAASFAKKFGIFKTLFAHWTFKIIELFLVYSVGQSYPIFYAVSVASALDIAFYWFGLHVIFAKSADKEKMGAHVSNLIALPAMIGLIAPLTGGLIAALLGFKVLIIIASLVYLVSLIPLLFIENVPVDVRISYSGVLRLFRGYKKYFKAEIFLNLIGEIEGYMLPIFMYLAFKDVLSVAALAAYLGLGAAIFTMFIGRISDKVDKKKILRIGAVIASLLWVCRYFADSQIQFFVLSVLVGFFGVLISVPFNSILYKNAKESHVEDFIIFREIPVSIGRVAIYSIGLLLVSNIKLSFLVAAVSYLYLLIF